MGDAADILSGAMTNPSAVASDNESSGPASAGAPPPPPPPSHHPSRALRATGMSRDVVDLLKNSKEDRKSASLPPIVPSFPIRGKKQSGSESSNKDDAKGTIKVGNRLISKDKPARQWQWASFASSARTDGARFSHWVRANVEYPDYPYARFDIHLDPVVYTEREYQQYLQNPDWTKSETDQLMELARRHELRWAVIHDGWLEAGQAPSRKIEDMQYRYYSVAALLTQSRVSKEAAAEVASLAAASQTAGATDEENLAMETAAARAIATVEPIFQPLIATIGTGASNKNVFDLTKERERRAHLELIWNRTKEEELEESELRKELRLVEAQIRKLKKSGGHILAAGTGGSSQNPSRSVTPVPMAAAAAAAGRVATVADSDLLDQCFASTAPTPMPKTPYLQSGRLVPPATGGPVGLNKTTLSRMDEVLKELKVPQRPLPTKRVCDVYDAVRKDALTLITLQKMILQREGQLQGKRVKLAKAGGGVRVLDEEALLGIAPPTPSGGTTTSTSAGGSRYKSGSGGKTKTPRTGGKSKGSANKSEGGSDSKGGKKGSSKRKKKSDTKTPAAAASGSAAATTAKRDDDDGKPNKKRVRKS